MSKGLGESTDRQEQLREIVKDLHEGSSVKSVQKRFAELIRGVSPQEIADMEQALIAGGVPVEQAQKVCDVHVQVFEQALQSRKKTKVLPGHPVHTFQQENKAARRVGRDFGKSLKRLPKGGQSEDLRRGWEELKKIEIHYRRKENQLFPYLEQTGFTGPSKVMWGKHDEIRAQLRECESALGAGEWKRLKSTGRSVLRAIKRMIFMEERILFPTAMKKLTDEQWVEIRGGEPAIGYAWVDPGSLWDPALVLARGVARDLGKPSPAKPTSPAAGSGDREAPPASIPLDVGRLSGEQINLLLTTLPLDVTYVDENDKVLYYSQGRERIFPRSPAVIGRAVQNCHPPSSVGVVEKILQSFRDKEKDSAEFWLTMNERFIHIRYFALYDGQGAYRGVLEVSQDATDLRGLEGQRTLLDW